MSNQRVLTVTCYVLGIAAVMLLRGWTLMILVGVVRDEWLHQLPTIGYHSSVVIATMLNVVIQPFSSVGTKRDVSPTTCPLIEVRK